MGPRALTLTLALAFVLPAGAQGPEALEGALEAVAFKAFEAQTSPPLLPAAAEEWKRLKEDRRHRAALAEPAYAEKVAAIEALLSVVTPERYAALLADPEFPLFAERRGLPRKTLAELRRAADEYDADKAAREGRWAPPSGDAEAIPAAAAKAAMDEGYRRYEALKTQDPAAAARLLDRLFDFSRDQARRDDMVGDPEKQRAVNQVVAVAERLRRAAPPRGAAPVPAARPAPPRAPAPSALRSAFCAAFANLAIPPGLSAAAAACTFREAERRLAADKARAARDLLAGMLEGDAPPDGLRSSMDRLVRSYDGFAREPEPERSAALARWQRDADRFLNEPRALRTLQEEKLALSSAAFRGALAAELLSTVAEEGARRRPDLAPLVAKLGAAPETLSDEEWGRLEELFAAGGASQSLLREALAGDEAARAGVERFYSSHAALTRYRRTFAALASARLAAMADGRIPAGARGPDGERFTAGELGLTELPAFIEIEPGRVEGRNGVWAHRHGRRVFTALDGSLEVTEVLGDFNAVQGRLRRETGRRVLEVQNPAGGLRGVEFEVRDLVAAPRARLSEAAAELAEAMARPGLGGLNAKPDAVALASFLEDVMGDARALGMTPAALTVSADGALEAQLVDADGIVRSYRARFEAASDFNGTARGVALVVRAAHTARPGEAPAPASSKKSREYLADGTRILWHESRSAQASGLVTDASARITVTLIRGIRGAEGEWVDTEREPRPREVLVEPVPDSSSWRIFRSELYVHLTSGSAGRFGVGPLTLGNALRAGEAGLGKLGWAGDKAYHAIVGVGQADVAFLTGSVQGALESRATLARLQGMTVEDAVREVRRLPVEQRNVIDARVYADRERDMKARGDTMTRLGPAEYQRLWLAAPTDEERARALLERFGAGTYGARGVEEAGRREGAASAAFYVAGGAMQFGEDTARSLPQMLALNMLGRLAALKTPTATGWRAAAGTGATVAQTGIGRALQVTGGLGTLDGLANVADGLLTGDAGKVSLAAGGVISDLVDIAGAGAELAKTRARRRALAALAGPAPPAPRAAPREMTDIRRLAGAVYEIRAPGATGDSLIVKLNATGEEAANLRRASAVRLPPEADNVRIPGFVSEGPEGLPSGAGADLRREAAARGEGRVPLVMEAARGEALKDFIDYGDGARRPHAPISQRDWDGLRRAVAALNAAGVQHGDLKNPENIRVWTDENGRTRFELIDWGGPANPRAALDDAAALDRLEGRLRDSGLLPPRADVPAGGPAELLRGVTGDAAGRGYMRRALTELPSQAADRLRRMLPSFGGRVAGLFTSNADIQRRALERFQKDPDAVVGVLISDPIAMQSESDCALRALYNQAELSPVRDVMSYDSFRALAERIASAPLRREGTYDHQRNRILNELGYAVRSGRMPGEAGLLDLLRGGGSVQGNIQWTDPITGLTGVSAHAIVVAGAMRDDAGNWSYLIADSNFHRYQTYSYAELVAMKLETATISPVAMGRTDRGGMAAKALDALQRHGAPAAAPPPAPRAPGRPAGGRVPLEDANLALMANTPNAHRSNLASAPDEFTLPGRPAVRLTRMLSDSGSSAVVFEGRQAGVARPVAVKVDVGPLYGPQGDPAAMRAAWQARVRGLSLELDLGRRMAAAMPPGMAPAFHDLVRTGGNPGVTMDLVPGKDLYAVTGRELLAAATPAAIRQVADAIRRLNAAGLGGVDSPQLMFLDRDAVINGTPRRRGDPVFVDAGGLWETSARGPGTTPRGHAQEFLARRLFLEAVARRPGGTALLDRTYDALAGDPGLRPLFEEAQRAADASVDAMLR